MPASDVSGEAPVGLVGREPVGLVVQTPGGIFPLVTTPAGIKDITGDSRSEHAIRDDCTNGVIPTLPRADGSGAHHRIVTARYLERLGVPFEIVPAESVRA
ncbi:MAG: hypothetical protein WB765_13710 [Acidimicrobiales bacterium]|jgi:hypothetical protein